jgi:ubiquinone/menaquinone biosynthesis C-methylase UbiE
MPPLTISSARTIIENDWKNSPYYDEAENAIVVFWSDQFPFLRHFLHLNLDNCIELACGHGRHTAQILRPGRKFILVDVNRSNIDFCRRRFAESDNLTYHTNDGSTLKPITDSSATSLFCYDAMVHFELTDVISYLEETRRVLVTGGQAVFHFSNYDKAPGGLYQDNPHWRNFNSIPIFKHMATRAGLEVCDIEPVNWGHEKALDAVARVRKP